MLPKSIKQTGAQTFLIEWRDGLNMEYHLEEVQKACPCVTCRKGERKVDKAVTVQSIESVGRYALRFTFTTGCHKGVYTYSLLRQLGRRKKA